jgi:hypothetical protein
MRYECLNAFSELHHLVDVAEDHVLGGGVDEAAGVRVQQLGKGEPGTSTSCEEVPFSTTSQVYSLGITVLINTYTHASLPHLSPVIIGVGVVTGRHKAAHVKPVVRQFLF